MHLPKQAAPIQRILALTAISRDQGVDPSLSNKDLDDLIRSGAPGWSSPDFMREREIQRRMIFGEKVDPLMSLLGL